MKIRIRIVPIVIFLFLIIFNNQAVCLEVYLGLRTSVDANPFYLAARRHLRKAEYIEAMPLLEKALSIVEKNLATLNKKQCDYRYYSDLFEIIDYLGRTYENTGNFIKTENLYKGFISKYSETLVECDPLSYYSGIMNLTRFYYLQKDFEKAKKYIMEAWRFNINHLNNYGMFKSEILHWKNKICHETGESDCLEKIMNSNTN